MSSRQSQDRMTGRHSNYSDSGGMTGRHSNYSDSGGKGMGYNKILNFNFVLLFVGDRLAFWDTMF